MSYARRGAGDAQITPELVEAWRRKDYNLVQHLLRLKPHECSPTWCLGRWFEDESPCSDEPHRGCHRAGEIRDALNAAIADEA